MIGERGRGGAFGRETVRGWFVGPGSGVADKQEAAHTEGSMLRTGSGQADIPILQTRLW